jgi:hypothetical protein
VQSNHLKQHIERNHSEKGVQRRKKREGASRSTSLRCKFRSITSMLSTSAARVKKLARVDFVVYKTDRVVAVECDEDSHKGYTLLRDVTRCRNPALAS